MPYEAKTIAGFKHGKQANKKPFLFFEDGFESLRNAYVWRDEVKRVAPSKFLARLRRVLTAEAATTSVAIAATATNFNLWTTIGLEANAEVIPGDVNNITISFAGGADVLTDSTGTGVLTVSASTQFTGTWTVNYNTGEVTITGGDTGAGYALGTAVTITLAYYPRLPCMGLRTQERTAINAEDLIAFDTVYSYKFNNATQLFDDISTTALKTTTWSGSDSDFFDTHNAYDIFWSTNNIAGLHGYTITNITQAAAAVVSSATSDLQVNDFVQFINVQGMTEINGLVGQVTAVNPGVNFTVNIDSTGFTGYSAGGLALTAKYNTNGDGIRLYNGDAGINQWYNFNPAVNTTTALQGARLTVFYRDRIVALSTWEGNTLGSNGSEFPQRARYSQNGTPFVMQPDATNAFVSVDAQAWREDVVGRGGFIDCPTNERIIGAGFLKDTLIVGFERSRWRLRYTGNELLPFVWERINIDIGWESQFSGIQFDEAVVAVGSRGIAATDGVSTKRIDEEIPDEAFSFENEQNGPARVYGLRDFRERIVYLVFPDAQNDATYPNRLLIWNYEEGAWGGMDESFTCLGVLQPREDETWGNDTGIWQDDNTQWVDPNAQALYQQPIGGNQQGFVREIQEPDGPLHSLSIRDITRSGDDIVIQSPSHNLLSGQYVRLNSIDGSANLEAYNQQIFRVFVDPNDPANQFKLELYDTTTELFYLVRIAAATPISYIGKGMIELIPNMYVRTKEFNPYLGMANSVRIGYTDWYVNTTDTGRVLLNIYVDGDSDNPVNVPDPDSPLQNRIETFVNPYELSSSQRRWVSNYNSAEGSFFQLELTLGPEEMFTASVALASFNLYAIALWMEKGGRRLT